jgi:hypothetical protein
MLDISQWWPVTAGTQLTAKGRPVSQLDAESNPAPANLSHHEGCAMYHAWAQ